MHNEMVSLGRHAADEADVEVVDGPANFGERNFADFPLELGLGLADGGKSPTHPLGLIEEPEVAGAQIGRVCWPLDAPIFRNDFSEQFTDSLDAAGCCVSCCTVLLPDQTLADEIIIAIILAEQRPDILLQVVLVGVLTNSAFQPKWTDDAMEPIDADPSHG